MKKLNKHPRLYKKMANTLKKLITNKLIRLKMINGQNKNTLKSNGTNVLPHQFLKPGQQIPSKLQKGINNNIGINQINNNNEFSRIINVASFRKIPFNEFILRLTPYDYETYLKMIKMNYSCRLEIHITNLRSIKYILEVLLEKWRNIPKIEPKIHLYLIPIRELWIPKELIFFSINDCERIYDIGDIYTAYGSPSTNILYMKYQWNEEKLNLNSYNNLNNNQNNELFFNNNNLLNNNNLSIQQVDSLNETEYKPENRLIKALTKLENSNLLNRSHTTIYNNLNNNQINFFSNKAIKADESQDLFDLSDFKDSRMGGAELSMGGAEKKNINVTESLNRNDDYPLFDDKYSDQDSDVPLDSELLDPMELLGFDNDKKFDQMSNSASNKVRTPSISKKIHLRHKKITFVNNVKPTESMINSSFVNKSSSNNNTGLKLRTGYSEVFSNNNSNNNANNVNNLAYTSNNNLSEVSSHINNSNHYPNGNQAGSGLFSNQTFLNKNSNKGNNSNINKSPIFNFGNNSKNKDSKNKTNLINNSNIEEESKDNKDSNIYSNSKNDIQNNNISENGSKKKKKIKFVNNFSKEKSRELKQIQESEKVKNSSAFEKMGNFGNNNPINNPNLAQSKNSFFLNNNLSFGSNPIQNNNNNNNIVKENNTKENKNVLTPSKEKVPSANNEDSPIYKNNNSNKKKIILNNNHSNNFNYGIGGGLTRFLGNNNSIGFGLNDTTPFLGQPTLNYNGFFDNATMFKNTLNNSNIFHLDNEYINEDNQLSQMMFMNRNEERIPQQMINSSFIGPNSDNQNNVNNNSNHSIHSNRIIEYNNNNIINNNVPVSENLNNNLEIKNNNIDEINDKNKNSNSKELLNKKRNSDNKEQKQKKTKKNQSHNSTNEKKSNKKEINKNNIAVLNNNNISLKIPNFNTNYNNNNINNINNLNNIRSGNKGIYNNFPVNKQYNPPFPYNIDIPLPSRFFEESINNIKK